MEPVNKWLVASMLLLVAPLAAAQDATPTIGVTGTALEAASLDAPATVDFEVTLESDNPFDAVQPRTLNLYVDDLEPGWVAQVSPTSLTLAAGESARVTVTVATSGDASDSTSVTLNAQLLPRGVNAVPGVGPVLDPDAEGSGTVTVDREDSVTRAVMESLGGWLWLLLAGLVLAAVIVGILLRQRNRQSVRLHVPEEVLVMKAGDSETVPVLVENLLDNDDTVVFQIAHEEGWGAQLPVPELALSGRRTEELPLLVHAPKDATPGTYTVAVSAHSAASPQRVAEAIVTIQV